MKLDPLSSEFNFFQTHAVPFTMGLRYQGWIQIERKNEEQAIAFMAPDRKSVVRLSVHNGHESDHGFQVYADLCQRNAGNPYLQKVYSCFTLADGSHVTHMERLVNCKKFRASSNPKMEPLLKCHRFLNDGFNEPELCEEMMKDGVLKDTLRLLFSAIDFNNGSGFNLDPTLDVHGNNIMARIKPDGSLQPVLSDPIATLFHSPDEPFHVCERIDPWTMVLRRKLGMIDPAYIGKLPEIKNQTWHWPGNPQYLRHAYA